MSPPATWCTKSFEKATSHSHSFFLAATHLFVDGMSFANIIGTCLDGPVMDYTHIPQFDYVPLITEASTILSLVFESDMQL